MKHVLITGGTDGIGKVAAARFVAAGYMVTILGRNEEKSQQVAEEVSCSYAAADVADYDQVEAAVQKAVEANGPVDILINNAGLWVQGPLEEYEPDEIKRVIDTNVLGVINCAHVVLPEMKQRQTGRIINISSQAGLYAGAEKSVYNASKWAVTGFTKALSAELKPFGISVTGLYPAAINTGLFEKAGNDKNLVNALDPSTVADALLYICAQPDNVNIPELGLQNIDY